MGEVVQNGLRKHEKKGERKGKNLKQTERRRGVGNKNRMREESYLNPLINFRTYSHILQTD